MQNGEEIPRSETDKFNSGVLCRIYDDEEDDHETNHGTDISTARRRKKNNLNGTGSCLRDQEKQDRVLATRVSEKWKKREGVSKSKNLMPDLMETSETESAKGSASGSMESETADLPGTDVIIPPPGGTDPSFPSNSDGFLRRLGLHKDSLISNDSLTEQEIECKFGSLALAFKTDKLTLSKRLDLQQRQRDTAEKNVESEIKALKESLNTLNHQSISQQVRELITKIQQQVDVLQQSTSRVSSRAEVYGAVQQEEKMSRAFDVMVMYVENVKRLYEKEHNELEEVRRLMTENRTTGEESKVQRPIRSSTVAGVPKPV
ncbi:protein MRVI1-like [Limulus polyphemus]|uniref:Protein MRVI1-like n=1 Tax=Limulus polyphemus TaxID=6850 RepID=A0ABM1TCQ1_LIMPO|nr:protein MRVI1-like [Limulus polyphemus]